MKKSIRRGALAAMLLAGAIAAGAAARRLSCPDIPPIRRSSGMQAAEAAVLKKGSTGGEVKEVQRRLKEWGYYTGEVDGIFGSGTRAAVVRRFRKRTGLPRTAWWARRRIRRSALNDSYNLLAGQGDDGEFHQLGHVPSGAHHLRRRQGRAVCGARWRSAPSCSIGWTIPHSPIPSRAWYIKGTRSRRFRTGRST